KLLSRRRRACVSRLTEPLPWRSSRRLLSGMLDRIVSYHDQFAAKWRRRFRREKRPLYRECLRNERNRNDDDRCCCTSHVRAVLPESDIMTSKILTYAPIRDKP